MAKLLELLTLLQASIAVAVATNETTNWPYLQTYPNETDDGRTPLYISVVLSADEKIYKSIGALPGIQVALDYINREPSFLPGYSLHYTLTDSQCKRSTAIESYFAQLTNPPYKVGWIGSGCSPATEPTAELSQHHNITLLSCISSSPDLHDRERFYYYFQLLSPEDVSAFGFYSIIRHFGWKRVGIITQGETLFIATAEKLKKLFTENNINYTEWFFRSGDKITDLNIFDSQTRIYIVEMYSAYALELFCEAYRRNLLPPKYLFLTIGWYVTGWWKEGYTSGKYNCSGDELARVARYSIGVSLSEYPENPNATDLTNTTTEQFETLYKDAVRRYVNRPFKLMKYVDNIFPYSYHCYEAVFAFAYALNKTITDLAEDDKFNRAAANLSNIPDGETFTMANFTYENNVVLSRMFKHLHDTFFPGITGNDVVFNDQGTRVINRIIISQYNITNDGEIHRPDVAYVIVHESNSTLYQHPSSSFLFSEGIPNDGTTIHEVVSVSLPLAAVYIIFAVAGIVFAVVCILFNLIFKNKRLIRLSSPNLNYFICLGAIILYLNIITLVVPSTNPDITTVLCNIHPWLFSLGYSFCYGPIIIKMMRICVIFSNPLKLKVNMFRDRLMVLFVLCLGIIDIAILLLYTIAEAVRDNLGVKLISNRERPEETFGATAEQYKYFIYVCESNGHVILYAILFGYKGILQASALLLAFFTRNVKVKGLDDSMYIAAAVYVTSIVLAVIIVSTYTLFDYVNAYPAVVGVGLLLGTTAILSLVFIPRMVELYKDPEGNSINTFHTSRQPEGENNNNENGVNMYKSDDVLQLRKRVNELENDLNKQKELSSPPPITFTLDGEDTKENESCT